MNHTPATVSGKTLSETLREGTASRHEQTEGVSRFSRIGAPDFSKEEYIALLKRFYGFYQPIEATLSSRFQTEIKPLNYDDRWKLPWLIEDLTFLGVPAESLKNVSLIDPIPGKAGEGCWPSMLGILYVLEGSTMGGQFISKKLKEHFGFPGEEALSGVHFYASYGKEAMPYWRTFKAFLDTATTAEHFPTVLNAACETFDSLMSWMDAE